MTAIFLAAIGLDSLTYLFVVPFEANPIVIAFGPALSLAIRWSMVALLLVTVRKVVHKRRFLLIGAIVGIIGAASNVIVLAEIAGLSRI
jgi:hypothetical protein